MSLLKKTVVISCFVLLSITAKAAEQAIPEAPASASEAKCSKDTCLPKILEYLKNFGANFGYHLEKAPEDIQDKLDEKATMEIKRLNTSMTSTFIGALIPPIDSQSKGADKYNLVIQQSQEPADFINEHAANALLSTGGKEDAKPFMTADQFAQATPTQLDPVAQILLNTISIPPACLKDATTCKNPALNSNTSLDINTALKAASLSDFYNNDNNNNLNLVSTVLNANTLITPFMISGDGSKPEVSAQQVIAFIQYISGAVLPLDLPQPNILTTLAISDDDPKKNREFRSAIESYILSLRIYTARLSVGLSNLYTMLAKRLPQKNAGGATTSQAYDEYIMATRRLFIPDKQPSDTPTWLDHINTASPAVVQKEIAILLAEINYQLYLSRQDQERLLMTSSVSSLIEATRKRPNPANIVAVIEGKKTPTKGELYPNTGDQ